MGLPKLGVCYYPEHWPEDQWESDAKQMSDLGLSWVRIGEFAWSRIEPEPGKFNWSWLDRAIHILHSAGLQIVLGTPTATPPRWMIEKHPDMLAVDKNGRFRKFGSRRHYCFSHEGYREEAKRIVKKLGERYGKAPGVNAWQIDNEYGCHDTALSYSKPAEIAFRAWLKEKYKDIDALNEAWGNVFWSMEYDDFENIDLPNLTVTEPNPAHLMDFRRFSSDQVVLFNRSQCDVLRALTDKPLIHNYMGRITDFDHFEVGADLDIASWDSYPLGFLEDRSDQTEEFKNQYYRQGDPDFQTFHHDLYRAVGRKDWWVMEQQPGAVNWAPYNPKPLPGMVRLWTWEAIAHGADVISYFRWRQAPFGQEQMHMGLKLPDGNFAEGGREVATLSSEISNLDAFEIKPSKIAIVFDYASAWAWDIQPQGKNFDYFHLVYTFYSTLRKLGQSVDFIPASTSDFGDRDLVLIPGLFAWTEPLKKAIGKFQGELVFGPRTGSKTEDFQIPQNLPPNLESMDIKVTGVETIRPGQNIPLAKGGHFHIWQEFVETNDTITEKTKFGDAALVTQNSKHYICGWPDSIAAEFFLRPVLKKLNLSALDLPPGVRLHAFGPYTLYTNYSALSASIDDINLPPAGLCLIEKNSNKVIISN